VGDTLTPRARVLNLQGDSVHATVYWAALDTAVAAVLDSESGATLGVAGGTGRLQARVGALRSNPVTLVVHPPLDSIRPLGDVRDTVDQSAVPPDSLSDTLLVQVFAPTPPPSAQTLARRRVTYTLTLYYPGPGPLVTLLPGDTVLTSAAGTAGLQVRLDAGPPPDSVRVTASAVGHDGTPAAGSPVTFVVEFRP
jgi:hypothetical protein